MKARIPRLGAREAEAAGATMAIADAPESPTAGQQGIQGLILDAMPERVLQNTHIVDGLKRRGFVVWTVPNMKKTAAGLPDLLAYHPARPGALFAWELKKTTGRLSADQRQALEHLGTVAGVDARVVRPRDWAALRDVLDNVTGSDLIDVLSAISRGF